MRLRQSLHPRRRSALPVPARLHQSLFHRSKPGVTQSSPHVRRDSLPRATRCGFDFHSSMAWHCAPSWGQEGLGFRVYARVRPRARWGVFGCRATAEARARRSEATRVHAVIDRGGYRGGTSERARGRERERRTREPVGDVHAVTSRDRSIRGGGGRARGRARGRGGREREGREGRTGKKRRRAPWRW